MNIILEVKANKEITQNDFIGCDYIEAKIIDENFLMFPSVVKCSVIESDRTYLTLELIDMQLERFDGISGKFRSEKLVFDRMKDLKLVVVEFEVESENEESLTFSITAAKFIYDSDMTYEIPEKMLCEVNCV